MLNVTWPIVVVQEPTSAKRTCTIALLAVIDESIECCVRESMFTRVSIILQSPNSASLKWSCASSSTLFGWMSQWI